MDSTEQRLAALEARVAALERSLSGTSEKPAPLATDSSTAGNIIFGGDVSFGDSAYQYQWQRPSSFFMERRWDEEISRIAAIASPTRADILKRLLAAPATAAELVEEKIVSSTGTAYHHLNELSAAGWIFKVRERSYEIRPARVIPLLTIISAGEDH